MILRNMNWERAILSDLILSETGAQERENLRGEILSLVKNAPSIVVWAFITAVSLKLISFEN